MTKSKKPESEPEPETGDTVAAPAPDVVAAVPPAVQLDASDDAEIQRRSELRLKGPRQDVQAARERAQSPGFVPAESEESTAFHKLQSDVAREVRAEVLQEKIDASKADGGARPAGEQPK